MEKKIEATIWGLGFREDPQIGIRSGLQHAHVMQVIRASLGHLAACPLKRIRRGKEAGRPAQVA